MLCAQRLRGERLRWILIFFAWAFGPCDVVLYGDKKGLEENFICIFLSLLDFYEILYYSPLAVDDPDASRDYGGVFCFDSVDSGRPSGGDDF